MRTAKSSEVFSPCLQSKAAVFSISTSFTKMATLTSGVLHDISECELRCHYFETVGNISEDSVIWYNSTEVNLHKITSAEGQDHYV